MTKDWPLEIDIAEKHKNDWLPFTRTYIDEIKYRSRAWDLGTGWKVLHYLSTIRALISDIPFLPVTAYYKLKDRLSKN